MAVLLIACGGGSGSENSAPPAPLTTTAAAAGACGLNPITFANERWQGSVRPGPGGTGVLWDQAYTFTNPNTVDVRLSPTVVHLRLSDQGGHFLKFAKSTFRPAADEIIPAGQNRERVADVWLATGNTPTTEDLYATTLATVGGTTCPVAIERISTNAVPAHVLALPTCAPGEATAAC